MATRRNLAKFGKNTSDLQYALGELERVADPKFFETMVSLSNKFLSSDRNPYIKDEGQYFPGSTPSLLLHHGIRGPATTVKDVPDSIYTDAEILGQFYIDLGMIAAGRYNSWQNALGSIVKTDKYTYVTRFARFKPQPMHAVSNRTQFQLLQYQTEENTQVIQNYGRAFEMGFEELRRDYEERQLFSGFCNQIGVSYRLAHGNLIATILLKTGAMRRRALEDRSLSRANGGTTPEQTNNAIDDFIDNIKRTFDCVRKSSKSFEQFLLNVKNMNSDDGGYLDLVFLHEATPSSLQFKYENYMPGLVSKEPSPFKDQTQTDFGEVEGRLGSLCGLGVYKVPKVYGEGTEDMEAVQLLEGTASAGEYYTIYDRGLKTRNEPYNKNFGVIRVYDENTGKLDEIPLSSCVEMSGFFDQNGLLRKYGDCLISNERQKDMGHIDAFRPLDAFLKDDGQTNIDFVGEIRDGLVCAGDPTLKQSTLLDKACDSILTESSKAINIKDVKSMRAILTEGMNLIKMLQRVVATTEWCEEFARLNNHTINAERKNSIYTINSSIKNIITTDAELPFVLPNAKEFGKPACCGSTWGLRVILADDHCDLILSKDNKRKAKLFLDVLDSLAVTLKSAVPQSPIFADAAAPYFLTNPTDADKLWVNAFVKCKPVYMANSESSNILFDFGNVFEGDALDDWSPTTDEIKKITSLISQYQTIHNISEFCMGLGIDDPYSGSVGLTNAAKAIVLPKWMSSIRTKKRTQFGADLSEDNLLSRLSRKLNSTLFESFKIIYDDYENSDKKKQSIRNYMEIIANSDVDVSGVKNMDDMQNISDLEIKMAMSTILAVVTLDTGSSMGYYNTMSTDESTSERSKQQMLFEYGVAYLRVLGDYARTFESNDERSKALAFAESKIREKISDLLKGYHNIGAADLLSFMTEHRKKHLTPGTNLKVLQERLSAFGVTVMAATTEEDIRKAFKGAKLLTLFDVGHTADINENLMREIVERNCFTECIGMYARRLVERDSKNIDDLKKELFKYMDDYPNIPKEVQTDYRRLIMRYDAIQAEAKAATAAAKAKGGKVNWTRTSLVASTSNLLNMARTLESGDQNLVATVADITDYVRGYSTHFENVIENSSALVQYLNDDRSLFSSLDDQSKLGMFSTLCDFLMGATIRLNPNYTDEADFVTKLITALDQGRITGVFNSYTMTSGHLINKALSLFYCLVPFTVSSLVGLPENNICPPYESVVFKPLRLFLNAATTLAAGNHETGIPVVGNERQIYNRDNSNQTLYAGQSLSMGFVITHPENVVHIPGVQTLAYVGGGNNKFINPKSMEDYRSSQLFWAARTKNATSRDMPSLMTALVKVGTCSGNKARKSMSCTGRWDQFKNIIQNINEPAYNNYVHYNTGARFSCIWGLHALAPFTMSGFDTFSARNDLFWCLRGTCQYFDSTGSTKTDPGDSVWPANFDSHEFRAFRCGESPDLPQL